MYFSEWSICTYFGTEYVHFGMEYVCAYTHRTESGLPSPDLLHRDGEITNRPHAPPTINRSSSL
jgi:hypothetical protein